MNGQTHLRISSPPRGKGLRSTKTVTFDGLLELPEALALLRTDEDNEALLDAGWHWLTISHDVFPLLQD